MSADDQLAVSRLLRAPRALVYQAFTHPDHLAAWWGPVGNVLPRDEVEVDMRAGGHLRWTEIFPAQPDLRVRVEITLTAVKDGELLEGVMRVDRFVQGRLESFTSKLKVEFFEEGDTQTRLEIRQSVATTLAGRVNQGWVEALGKLEQALNGRPIAYR